MLVTILYRLEQSPEVTTTSKFTDVKAGLWYSEAVIWASENGIVNGYEDNTFKPMNNVSREEMAAQPGQSFLKNVLNQPHQNHCRFGSGCLALWVQIIIIITLD